MASRLHSLVFGAKEPAAVASFWAGVLQRELVESDGSHELPRDGANGFNIRFDATPDEKLGPNQMHFDLTSSSIEDQQAIVTRALDLGGRHIDVGQLPEEGHVVLADPEGNEFCVIPPGNNFLAGCGFLGALSSDGTEQVGRFWSEALAWPLVWDQDEETAIQSPTGGTKIAWGGPPVAPKLGINRLHFELVVVGDRESEVSRLVDLGAGRVEPGERSQNRPATHLSHAGAVAMIDPDGNEFCLLSARLAEA